jgi:hypothetical protein
MHASVLSRRMLNPPPPFPADRLLMERMRRNKSNQQFEDLVNNTAAFASLKDSMVESLRQEEDERLVVVANRLPVTCCRDANNGWQLQVGIAAA